MTDQTVEAFLKETKPSKFLKPKDGPVKVQVLTPIKTFIREEEYQGKKSLAKYMDVYDYESDSVKILKVTWSIQKAMQLALPEYDNDFSKVDFKISLEEKKYTVLPFPSKKSDCSSLERLNLPKIFEELGGGIKSDKSDDKSEDIPF